MPKISIVVPVYNVEKYIGECIESMIHQTLEDIEIILVDDGSPDESGKICDEYAAKDARVKVIHKQNGGVGAARNDGLAAATGDWIIFCDSDDWLEPDGLKQLVEAGKKSGADVVFGDVNLVYGDRVKNAVFYNEPFITSDRTIIDKLIEADFCKTYCFDPPNGVPAFGYGGPWNKIVRRKFLLDNNIKFDLRVKGIFDDILYTAYIFAAANTVQYLHATVYNYRQVASSITRKYKANLKEINEAIFVSWNEFMSKYGADGRFEEPYYVNVIRRLTTLFGQYYFNKNNKEPFNKRLKDLGNTIRQEPYASAVKKANFEKLNNNFDRQIVKAAKKNSAFQIYLVYLASVIKSKVKKK